MNILCTICARGGSIGVKNKNIRNLCGKPLIAHSILQARRTNLFNLIAVSSDSAEIRCIAKDWGADCIIVRPNELASSIAAKLPAIQHALLEAEKFSKDSFDLIIDLDATSPLRSVEDIIGAFNMFSAHPEAHNLVTGCIARRSPYFNMLEKTAGGYTKLVKKTKNINRRQDSPLCYDMNASIYIWKRDQLLNAKHTITERTLLYVMPEERSIDIDSMLDWELVEFLAKKRKDFLDEPISEFV